METLHVGVDVSKEKFNYAILRNGNKLKEDQQKIDYTGMHWIRGDIEVLRRQGEIVNIYIEQTGIYAIPLIKFFLESGYRVFLVDGGRFNQWIKLKGGKKTDKKDAENLALYGIAGLPTREIELKDLVIFELKQLITHRERLLKEINGTMNYLRQLVETEYPSLRYQPKTKLWRIVKNRQEQEYSTMMGFKALKWIIKEQRDKLLYLEEMLKDVEEAIEEFLKKYFKEDAEVLRSFGFRKTAGYLIATYGDITRFKNVKKFKKYMGLANAPAQSGKSEKERRTYNNKHIRKILYMYVVQNLRHENEVKRYYEKLIERGVKKKKKAIMKTASKVLEWIYYALKNKTLYDLSWLECLEEANNETQQKDIG
ncbi:IS110 family transposase [Hydrogenobacter hydrogenophilus]|uniref:Transposase n=1 Tax=Hydrogenobacter hydrogenophilus TaxID=35835 RepID=A0A285P6F0_9AQUI|nr:IS110 family transposase [Hydrogenobacter hydrogenophilus]SNZ16827.1 Transposase [Hydrogenobacter hydrogenophilus]